MVGLLYLDASALVKLVVDEAESGALEVRVGGSGGLVSSIIAAVEVPRAIRRVAPDGDAAAVLDRCVVVAIDTDLVANAASLDAPSVRALDAIHVATALALGPEIEAFVTYDRRQAAAAAAAGLTVESPGLEFPGGGST